MTRKSITRLALGLAAAAFMAAPALSQQCVDCHRKITPNLVSDWELSKHSQNGVDCATCHGGAHTTAADFASARIPTPETCAQCHEDKVTQYKKGKHALAWAAMNALPAAHAQPAAMMEGMKGCGGCHKIGMKSEADIAALKKAGSGFGLASCDACHTRHTFFVNEARQPQACQTCHMGFDHSQWEMYSASKHGVRYLLKQAKVLPESAAAPTCQTCHMREGNHEVRTAWGFLGVRLPLPEDKSWAADRTTILEALGVLDPQGKPTARLDIVKAADVARLTQESWQAERDKMLLACAQCHSAGFAKGELAKGDEIIKASDTLMAEAVRLVAGLYRDGLLAKPADYAYPFPDILALHEAPTEIEQALFVMFLEHRQRTYQGTFHANPDYALWYGWSELKQSLGKITSLAEGLRRAKAAAR